MAIVRKNIWTLFYILLLGGFIFLGITAYYKWHSIYEKYLTAQINIVRLIANASHSLFSSQEMMLTILGNEILKDNDTRILDDLLKINPSIVGFGFSDPDGNLLYVSSNMTKSKLPNIKMQPTSQDSFLYALTQNKMVLGRTYFMKALNEWVIPVRQTIRDRDGTIKGMMTAGLRIKGVFKLFSDNLHLGEFNKVSFIREKDRYIQFRSSPDDTSFDFYKEPISESDYQQSLDTISKKYNLSQEAIKQSKTIFTYELKQKNNTLQTVVKYDPRFEIWTVSEINHNQIQKEFIVTFLWYVFIFILIHTIVFFLFRIISTAEEKRRNDLFFQATHDPLTLLPNRSFLQQHIKSWIYTKAPPFSVFYLDMDHFKNVNDSFGHKFGDQLLIELAQRIRHIIRDDNMIIRQGGDEFIILSYKTNDEELLNFATMLIHEISKPYHINHFSFVIGVSIGIAKYPEHGNTLDMLLRAADIAMYASKKHKNSAHIFLESMQEGYLNKVAIEQALRQAIDTDAIFMVYQPQIDHHGNIYGVEALVRWHDKTLGFVPPDQFIAIAEASGMMPKLGHFILVTTLKEMYALQQTLNTTFQISINISIKQFMEANFFESLTTEIAQTKIDHSLLCLEITENLFIEDITYILPLLQKIHAMGIHISMDDFGTGYSSLSMLRDLPIDELKIDKSFVDTILNNDTAKKMIQNIIAIGKNLDLAVLAEGVETKEQETLLRSFGCDRFQGYFYAKPLPYEALKSFLTK